jgi:hypothetical protein
MTHGTGLVPEEQTDHRAVSASFTPGGKNAHDVAYEASEAAYDMLEDISANRSGACVDTGDALPAENPVSDTDEQPTEDVEPDRLTFTTGSGSETFVPPPVFALNTTLPSGVPARMLVDSTSPVPQQMDRSHELESVALRSTTDGKDVKWGSEVTSILGSHTAAGNASSAGQSRITVEGTAQAHISSPAPSFFEHGPPVPNATDSPSTDNISHLSPNVDNSEVAMPTAKPDATLMPTQDIAMSSLTTTSKRNRQITTAQCALQEPSLSSLGSTISPAPQTLPGMCYL